MKIISIIQENGIVNVTISMNRQIFTISTSIEKATKEPDYLINWINRYKLLSKITEKKRKKFLSELQNNPIFGIIAKNPYTGNEYRIK